MFTNNFSNTSSKDPQLSINNNNIMSVVGSNGNKAPVLVTCYWDKIPDISSWQEKELHFGSEFVGRLVMVGESWQQEVETAGNTASSVRKQRWMHMYSCLLLFLQPPAREMFPPTRRVSLPTLTNLIRNFLTDMPRYLSTCLVKLTISISHHTHLE